MTRAGAPRGTAVAACLPLLLLLGGCIQPAVIAREPGAESGVDAAGPDAVATDDTAAQPDAFGPDALPGMDATSLPDDGARPDTVVLPDVPTDPPDASGTRTLVVSGEIESGNTTSNALTTDDYRTQLEISVTRRGVPVTDAVVVVTSTAGAVTLTLSTEPGQYVGSQTGYFTTYTIDVTADADAVHGARVTGPVAHVFVAPRTGEHHRIATPLTVQWSPGGASDAVIATTVFPLTRIADTGTYTIPASALMGTAGALRDDFVQLTRTASVPVTGGAVGSFVRVSVRNGVSFVLDGT